MTERSKYEPMLDRYHEAMLVEMRANEDKDSWEDLSPAWALNEVHYHVAKLHWAMRHTHERGWNEVREFAADVGNICAMLTDLIPAEAQAEGR